MKLRNELLPAFCGFASNVSLLLLFGPGSGWLASLSPRRRRDVELERTLAPTLLPWRRRDDEEKLLRPKGRFGALALADSCCGCGWQRKTRGDKVRVSELGGFARLKADYLGRGGGPGRDVGERTVAREDGLALRGVDGALTPGICCHRRRVLHRRVHVTTVTFVENSDRHSLASRVLLSFSLSDAFTDLDPHQRQRWHRDHQPTPSSPYYRVDSHKLYRGSSRRHQDHEGTSPLYMLPVSGLLMQLIVISQIRGAPAIATLASLAVAQDLSRTLKADTATILASSDALRAYLNPVLDYLFTSRPTAVNLGTAIKRLRAVLLAAESGDGESNVRDVVLKLIAEAHLIADEDVGRNKEMSRRGAEWLLEELERRGSPKLDEGGKVNVYAVSLLRLAIRIMISYFSGICGAPRRLTVCNTGSLGGSWFYGTKVHDF